MTKRGNVCDLLPRSVLATPSTEERLKAISSSDTNCCCDANQGAWPKRFFSLAHLSPRHLLSRPNRVKYGAASISPAKTRRGLLRNEAHSAMVAVSRFLVNGLVKRFVVLLMISRWAKRRCVIRSVNTCVLLSLPTLCQTAGECSLYIFPIIRSSYFPASLMLAATRKFAVTGIMPFMFTFRVKVAIVNF